MQLTEMKTEEKHYNEEFAEKWGWSFNTPNELKEAFGKNTQIV